MRKAKKYRQLALILVFALILSLMGGTGAAAVYASETTEYTSDEFTFSWSGGSGRVEITCEKLDEEDGQAWAFITFSSGKYSYAKVDGTQYLPDSQGDDYTTFKIPVELNTDTDIIGCTTAMSQPHEIEYTLHFELGGSKETSEEDSSKEGGSDTEDSLSEEETDSEAAVTVSDEDEAPEIPGLSFESELEREFAECFHIYYYSDDYTLIDIPGSGQFLLVPEDKEAPDGLDKDIVVLQKPLDTIYLAATSAMALFSAVDALDHIKLSALQESGWYVDAAKEAMENGEIVYAGKYNEPDYELLVESECDLAIESTMILHSPKVQEMIEEMGIPVFTDRSSYETHPLGRTEWIKVYAEMVDKQEEAKEYFDAQASIVTELKDFENTEKTVAFFYVSTDGSVVVRKPTDYVPKMIEIAGGRYLPESVDDDEESRLSSIPMTMEEFYASAIDADYLIYNATIDNPITSIDDLLGKSDLFADFKAVQEGNVWCVGKYLYQATDIVGNMITDLHLMLTGGDEDQMTFMTKID